MATKENPAAMEAATGFSNLICKRLALRRCRTAKQQPADKQQSFPHFLHCGKDANTSQEPKSTQKTQKNRRRTFFILLAGKRAGQQSLDSVAAGWKRFFVEFFAQFFRLVRFELWNFATVVAFSGERVMLDEK